MSIQELEKEVRQLPPLELKQLLQLIEPGATHIALDVRGCYD